MLTSPSASDLDNDSCPLANIYYEARGKCKTLTDACCRGGGWRGS